MSYRLFAGLMWGWMTGAALAVSSTNTVPVALPKDIKLKPYPGITYRIVTGANPPTRTFIAEVDLRNPHVHVRTAPGGPNPDGPGHWETILMQPTKIAEKMGFDLVVNGDFFAGHKVHDGEGTNANFPNAVWASVAGPAMTDGVSWADAKTNRSCLVVHKDGHITLEMLAHASGDDQQVIAGNIMLVRNGKSVVHPGKKAPRNPRTAVGLDADGSKLIIVVIDGRKPYAVGTTDSESAEEMISLGCQQALNLDGGGSSVMAIRDTKDGKLKILNVPSDGRERAVGNVLGISVDH